MESQTPKVVSTLPMSHRDKADRYQRAAIIAYNRDKKLQSCTTESVLLAFYQACQIGLEVNTPRGHAYLIPYKDECTLQVGYKGMVELAYRTGLYESIQARLVGPRDIFRYAYNPDLQFIHEPAGPFLDTEVTHVYAMARLKGAREPIVEVMTRDEVIKVQRASRSGTSGPWTQWWGEMAKKTVLKRLLKYQPMSDELADAMGMDNEQYTSGGEVQSGPRLTGPQSLANRLSPPAPEPIESNPNDPNRLVEDDVSDFEEGRE